MSVRTFDLTGFHAFLDALHFLQSRPAPTNFVPLLSDDHKRMASTLREFVARLREARAAQSCSTTGHSDSEAVAVTHCEVESLTRLLSTIRAAFVRRLPAQFRPEKLDALQRCLALPAPPILSILGKETDENANSDVIAWLLDPRNAPTVAPEALRHLVGLLDNADIWRGKLDEAIAKQCVSVRREVILQSEGGEAGDRERVDILVTGPTFMLAIENKILSAESEGQTAGYWAWLKRRPILVGAIFLTPTGFPAQSSDFRPMSYLQLLDCLLEGPARRGIGTVEEVVLAGYVTTVADHILRCELRAIRGNDGGGTL